MPFYLFSDRYCLLLHLDLVLGSSQFLAERERTRRGIKNACNTGGREEAINTHTWELLL